MVKLIGLVGTNSKKSTNRQLLQYIQKHFSEQAEIELVEIKDIPMFNKPTPKVVPQGASYGTLGSSRAQSQLRQILNAPEIKARVLPSDEFLLGHALQAFDEEGNLKDTVTVEKLEKIFEDYLLFIEITKQLVRANEAREKEAKNFSWDSSKK